MTRSGVAQPIALTLDPAQARRQIESLLVTRSWTDDVDGVVLALHEALVNAERHAGGALRAEATLDTSSLVIQVWDGGPGFDPSPYVRRPPQAMAERGRGLWLISRIAASWEVRRSDEGSVLIMRFEHR